MLVVADQPDTAAAPMMNWTAVSRERVSAIPASSIITKVDRPIRGSPVGQIVVVDGPGEFGQGVGWGAGLLAELAAAAADGASPITWPPPSSPGRGQGAHGGGLPGAGGGDRQLQPGPGGGHRPDQSGLPGVQGGAVGGHLQQRQIDRAPSTARAVGAAGGGDEALLGGQDPGGGEQLGAGDGVDGGAVGAAQQPPAR